MEINDIFEGGWVAWGTILFYENNYDGDKILYGNGDTNNGDNYENDDVNGNFVINDDSCYACDSTIPINFLAMLSASQAFGEAVKEVYEPDWHGTEQLTSLLEVCSEAFMNL